MSEEFLGDLITVQPQSPKIPIHLRRTNTNLTYEQHQQKENERLQKDLQEKENYLSKLEGEVELLKECMVAFRKLISDVEISTGEDFLTREQKFNLANMPYNQAMTIIKSELVFLVKRQEELPKKYENQFIENVTKITDEIEAVEKKTQTLQKQRAKKGLKCFLQSNHAWHAIYREKTPLFPPLVVVVNLRLWGSVSIIVEYSSRRCPMCSVLFDEYCHILGASGAFF